MSSISEIEEHKEVEVEFTDIPSKKQKKKSKTQLKQENEERIKNEFKYTHVDPINPNLKSNKNLPESSPLTREVVKIDEPCHNLFGKDKHCKYGDKCRYSHVYCDAVKCHEDGCNVNVAYNPKYKVHRCAEHQREYVQLLKENRKKEALSKIPCKFYPHCLYGDSCIYLHGPDNDSRGEDYFD